MIKPHNKDAPGKVTGYEQSMHSRDGTAGKPRDGTFGKPRDGTFGNPRDGTFRNPRDGTGRKPRDETATQPRDWIEKILQDALWQSDEKVETSGIQIISKLSCQIHIRGRTRFRRRKILHGNRHFEPVMGEVRPEVNKGND